MSFKVGDRVRHYRTVAKGEVVSVRHAGDFGVRWDGGWRDFYPADELIKEVQVAETETELKVLPSRVREASEKCRDASRVLKELFPEAFPPRRAAVDGQITLNGKTAIAASSDFPGDILLYDARYDWKLELRRGMGLYLIPTLKK